MTGDFAGINFAETTMTLVNKLLLGAAAVVVATAASFPGQLSELYYGVHPQDMAKREALDACQANDSSFVRFFASDREACYAQMRTVGLPATFSGTWSKPDRHHPAG
jgi:hypothetical protein